MRRGVPRIGLSVEPAERAKRAAVGVRPGAGEADRLKPARVHLVRLPAATLAADGCSAVMALHAAAIAHNLDCVLTTLDPEGPHQLRVALRRMRVALRVFRPVMKKKANAHLAGSARALGRIVGELRDADVLIDEIIGPTARDQAALMSALGAWRQEVRGRVRAQLLAINASAFAADLARDAAASAWIKKSCGAQPASYLIAEALADFRVQVAVAAKRLPNLSHTELHALRKDVKALRYGTELAAAAGVAPADSASPLKRMQDLLGYANDMAALEQFEPPLVGHAEAWAQLHARILAARADRVAGAVADAARQWTAMSQTWANETATA
jgi:triphosphatase